MYWGSFITTNKDVTENEWIKKLSMYKFLPFPRSYQWQPLTISASEACQRLKQVDQLLISYILQVLCLYKCRVSKEPFTTHSQPLGPTWIYFPESKLYNLHIPEKTWRCLQSLFVLGCWCQVAESDHSIVSAHHIIVTTLLSPLNINLSTRPPLATFHSFLITTKQR